METRVEKSWQLALLDRMMAHRNAGNTTDMGEAVYRNRIDKYVRPERFEAEQNELFRKLPVIACMTADVRNPGDYVTLSVAEVPVLVVRGEDGVVRAFRNVCRHRGACVADGRGHTEKSFMCPYHAWSYRLDGSLIAMTHRTGFAGVDKTEHGLSPLPCGEHAGIVLVQLEGTPPSLDAAAWLGGVSEELASFGFENYFRTETRVSVREMNWKLMYDTFGEVYHVEHLHRQTIHPLIQSNNTLFDEWGQHGRMAVARWALNDLDNKPRGEWQTEDMLASATLVYYLLPNTVLIQQVDHLELYQIFPDGPDRCTALVSLYAPTEPITEKSQQYWKRNLDLLMRVTETEDFVMCEQIQRSFRSGAQEYIQFGRNEPGLTHYHSTIDRLLGLETPVSEPRLVSSGTAAGA